MINSNIMKHIKDSDLKDILSYLYKYLLTCDLNSKNNIYKDNIFIGGSLNGAVTFIYQILNELEIETHLFEVNINNENILFLLINCFEMDTDVILDPYTLLKGDSEIVFNYDLDTLFKLYKEAKIISFDNKKLDLPITIDNYKYNNIFNHEEAYTMKFN